MLLDNLDKNFQNRRTNKILLFLVSLTLTKKNSHSDWIQANVNPQMSQMEEDKSDDFSMFMENDYDSFQRQDKNRSIFYFGISHS